MAEDRGLGEELNIRIEVPNDDFGEEMEIEAVMTPEGEAEEGAVTLTKDVEDGECSALSESGSDLEMESENTGVLADVESSPMSRNYARPIFERGMSKLSTDTIGGEAGDWQPKPRQYPNPYRADEAKKRIDRAKRFQDSPLKIQDVEVVQQQTVSEDELIELYKSCGLFAEDWGDITLDKVGPQYRLDSILIRGINNMSTNEIFLYLFEMGLLPDAMEWVNDACCIAVYKDRVEAAASLLKVTKPISIDHDKVEKKKNLEIEEKSLSDDVQDNKQDDQEKSISTAFEYDSVTVVPHDEIAVPMPLGYVWRYAQPCEKATGILMRYATIHDRKQERAERHSEYYKKYGNPNNPKYRALEDDGPRRKRPSKRVRYNPSPEISSSEEEGNKFGVWTKLSQDWSYDDKGDGKSGLASTVRANTPIPNMNKRLGTGGRLAGFISEFQEEEEYDEQLLRLHPRHQPPSVYDKLDMPSSRKRMWREQEVEERQLFTAGHGRDEEWTTRLQGPTMRMQADVEESRKKLLASRKRIQHKPSIASRLGDKIDQSSPSRISVKERLGRRLEYDDDVEEREDESEDAYLESLIHNNC